MKKGLSLMTLLFALVLGNINSYAQTGLNPANKDYDRWAYINAIDLYEKVYKRGYSNQELVEKLGNAYYFNARYGQAETYYQKLFSEYESADISSEYFYRYAHTLQNIGNEADAKRYYDLFIKKNRRTNRDF
jgi:tetratricopeptide (TPR) repeat protein